MQPVNVLPTFVSQETDLKSKNSSESSDESNKEAEFSRLIDKHVDEGNTATNRKQSASANESATANSGDISAENGKDDTGLPKKRQESDDQINKVVNNDSQTAERLAKESEANQANKSSEDEIADTKALDESEQFISMLYNSDQTLTNAEDKTKQSSQANQVGNINNQQVSPVSNSDTASLDEVLNNKENAVNTDESNSALLTDHKLKAFSKDELLARSQLKNSNVFAQQPSDQLLKDYQQLLQSKQGMINNSSITSEQLNTSPLANTLLTNDKLANTNRENSEVRNSQLTGNKTADLTATVAQANKGLLNEQVDTGLYQLPVEPPGKDKQNVNDSALTAKASVVKLAEKESEKQNEKIAQLSTKSQADFSAKLPAEIGEESVNSATKITNNLPELINNKASSGETSNKELKSDKLNSPLSNSSLDKLNVERTAQVAMIDETIAKAQPNEAQTKQGAMTSAQVQALQMAQAQQKEQAVKSDLQSIEDVVDESDYAESMNLSEQKTKEQGINTQGKVIDSVATRSISEIQSQVIQANQAKQNNDAYIEHQTAEVLNYNIASDTIQIQKNNVQLQQETLSIFKKDFADAVKDKVMITINQKLQQFDITLDPPEFGNMQVRVNLQGEQATVNFVVQNQQAKDALEQNMHKLKEMLAEQGVDVGGANVEQQDQQQSSDEQGLGQSKNSSSLLTGQEEEHNVEHTLSAKLFDSSATGVDYYA